ncbi:MAG: hypothetical protein KF811_04345 [Dokdonella sp.]|nr:hypothetical protein [Dokdonella sp.]
MEAINVSFLTPSKAIIRDFDNGQLCVLRIGRTGFPVTKSDVSLALSKMKAVREIEQLYRERSQTAGFLRVRALDVDNKHSYSTTVFVDLVVAHGTNEKDSALLLEMAKVLVLGHEELAEVDSNGCFVQTEIALKDALLSSDNFHRDAESFYEQHL